MRITESKLRQIIRRTIRESWTEEQAPGLRVNPNLVGPVDRASMGSMTPEEQMEFEAWIEDGNAYEKRPGVWVEQSTQYRKEMSYEELEDFYMSEYL